MKQVKVPDPHPLYVQPAIIPEIVARPSIVGRGKVQTTKYRAVIDALQKIGPDEAVQLPVPAGRSAQDLRACISVTLKRYGIRAHIHNHQGRVLILWPMEERGSVTHGRS